MQISNTWQNCSKPHLNSKISSSSFLPATKINHENDNSHNFFINYGELNHEQLPKSEVPLKFSSSPEINKRRDIRNSSIQHMEGISIYLLLTHLFSKLLQNFHKTLRVLQRYGEKTNKKLLHSSPRRSKQENHQVTVNHRLNSKTVMRKNELEPQLAVSGNCNKLPVLEVRRYIVLHILG